MKRKGYTLIEVIVAIVLVAILTSVLAVYMREGFSAWVFLGRQKNLAAASRAAANRVVREIKRCNGTANILTFTSSTFSFVNVDAETVTFQQVGTELRRGSVVLLSDLKSSGGLVFTYLDKNGNTTAVRDDIRLVRCRITTVNGKNKFVVESAARIRIGEI